MDALYSSGDARILCWQSHSLNHQCSGPLTTCFHCAALSRPIALVQVGSSRPHSPSFFLPFSQVASSFSPSRSLARLPRNSGPEFNNERRAIIIIISPPPFKIGGAAVQWMGPLGFSGISERFITCEKSCGSSCGMEAVSFLLDREMEMCRQAAGRENISSQ